VVCTLRGRRGGGSAAAIPPSHVRPLVLLARTGAYSVRGGACGCPSQEGATVRGDGNGRRFHFIPRARSRHQAVLASEEIEVPSEHKLLAPTLLRSQTLSALHQAVHAGEIPPDAARDRLKRINAMPIRLLGDAVLRRRAWDLAERLGWAETYDAEYVALTQLQADAFVTLDAALARRVEGIVPTATIEALRTA
jgi:predicted nucleic acid-binding protein